MTEGSILIEVPTSGTQPVWKIDISIMHLKETFSNFCFKFKNVATL
jgi:hypothetical protein